MNLLGRWFIVYAEFVAIPSARVREIVLIARENSALLAKSSLPKKLITVLLRNSRPRHTNEQPSKVEQPVKTCTTSTCFLQSVLMASAMIGRKNLESPEKYFTSTLL